MSARSFDINKTTKQSNIQVHHKENSTYVTLHKTLVFSINKFGMIFLNSGGYRTNTTKTAINRAFSQLNINGQVSQVKGEWFVTFNGEKIPFKDEMVLNVKPLIQALT
jgi:hypothetical protein